MSSLNVYMHPRNPFKAKPDYKTLADRYPAFKDYLVPYSSNNSNKFKIDFNNAEALRCLSTVLLKDKFDLDVNIPLDRLIPSIPQRLNYILWLEDIIEKCIDDDEFKAGRLDLIDLGTGASCVFPLVSARTNDDWHFLATELDDYSLVCARQNCESNNLSNRITVIKGKSDQLIPDLNSAEFIALMCNPPFFEERTDDHKPSLSNTSIPVESTVEGGEETFVSRLIEESLVHRTQIRLYTVMLGRMISFKNLRKKLQSYREDGILNFIDTEFCQGKTIRLGLCWTFDLSLDLKSVNRMKHSKKKCPTFVHKIPECKFVYTYSLKIVANHILELLSAIEIKRSHLSNLKQTKFKIEFIIRTNLNTWSQQRRKRRLAERQANDHTMLDTHNEPRTERAHECRKRLADDLECSFDDLNIDQSSSDEHWKKAKFSESKRDDEFYLLNCVVRIEEEKEVIYLKMTANERIKDRDSVHQLFQYLKNNL